jgi:hypothetical protein
MKTLLHFAIVSSLTLLAGTANAGLINFAELANGATGESAWATFSKTDIDGTIWATADNTANTEAAFVYLDRNTGGMGVCSSGVDPAKANKTSNSGANLCGYPRSAAGDDNITNNELLTLKFSRDVIIETLWFNNFHDADGSLLGDQITIGDSDYTFTNGNGRPKTWSSTLVPYAVAANTAFDIAFKNEQFYLHQIHFSASTPNVTSEIPLPSNLALFGLGFAGLRWSKRRKNLSSASTIK